MSGSDSRKTWWFLLQVPSEASVNPVAPSDGAAGGGGKLEDHERRDSEGSCQRPHGGDNGPLSAFLDESPLIL